MTSDSNSDFAHAARPAPRLRKRWRAIGALLCAAGVAACDQDVTQPSVTAPIVQGAGATTGATFLCSASIHDRTVSCAPTTSTGSSRSALGDIIGGQDVYIRLNSSGTAYDAGTAIFQTDVTVQSLVQTLIGTSDSTTVDGVSVFFASGPTVTSGSGSISVANANGTGAFTGANQPFFLYPEILEPYQISAAKRWQFSVPATVASFNFTVYVSTTVVGPGAPLLDAVWGGTVSSDWAIAGNWQTGSVPNAGAVVAIPRATLLPSGATFPILSADDSLSALRVGEGSTLGLNGHRLVIARNVDAPGTISGGSIRLSGSGVRLGGNLPALEITGSARLQRPTSASGAVSVTGTLSVQNTSLSISLP